MTLRSTCTVALALLVLGAAGCSKPEAPEDLVRKALNDVVVQLEKGDVSAAGDVLSDEYADSAKRTKQQLKGIAMFVLRRGPILVAMQDVKVAVTGDTATATFKAFAVQGAAEVTTARDLLPQRAREFAMTTTWAREGKVWRIRSMSGDGQGGGD